MMEGFGAEPYLLLTDPDPGSPKTCGSYGSGSTTLTASLSLVHGVAHSLFVENIKVHYWHAGTVWNLPCFKIKLTNIIS
jgi:hypothetical protein